MSATGKLKRLRARYKLLGLPGSYAGADTLSKVLGGQSVKEALMGEDSYTLHRPVLYRFPRRKTIVSGPMDQFQCDLVDCSVYKDHNDGIRYLFCCIDVFTKQAWVHPLPSKRGQETAQAMESILKALPRMPLSLQSDKGTEMKAAPFQNLLKKYKIHFFTTENATTKAAVVERFQKTLQTMIHRYMTATRSRRFVDALPLLMKTYNTTYHSAIGMAPNDVTDANTEKVWQRLYTRNKTKHTTRTSDDLEPGDYVRISKARRQFAKGYTGHWSREIFLVTAKLNTTPTTYRISDMAGEEIRGTFYQQELQKISPPEYFDIEKISDTRTRRGKTEYLIKWTGFPTSFNSWERDLIKIA